MIQTINKYIAKSQRIAPKSWTPEEMPRIRRLELKKQFKNGKNQRWTYSQNSRTGDWTLSSENQEFNLALTKPILILETKLTGLSAHGKVDLGSDEEALLVLVQVITGQHFYIEKIGNCTVGLALQGFVFASATVGVPAKQWSKTCTKLIWIVNLRIGTITPRYIDVQTQRVEPISHSPSQNNNVIDVEPESHDSGGNSDSLEDGTDLEHAWGGRKLVIK